MIKDDLLHFSSHTSGNIDMTVFIHPYQ